MGYLLASCLGLFATGVQAQVKESPALAPSSEPAASRTVDASEAPAREGIDPAAKADEPRQLPSETPPAQSGETSPTPSGETSPAKSGAEPDSSQAARVESIPPPSRAPDLPPAQNLDEALRNLDDKGSPEKPTRDGEARPTGEDEPLPSGEKRKSIDYDGRPEPQTDAGDIVRWVPRVVFYPLYLVMEYGLRIPIVWTTTRVEETHLSDKVIGAFQWDQGQAYLYPAVTFDLGVRANAGLIFKWIEALPRHDFSAAAFVGFDDLWAFSGRVDQKLFRDEDALIRWSGSYMRRPDNVFFGISDVDARCNGEQRGCRYRNAIAEASLGLVGWEHKLNEVSFLAHFRHARFENERSDAPSLTEDESNALPGFTEGYQIFEPKFTFAVDSRDEDLDFHAGTGLRLEGQSAFAIDVSNPDSRWWRAGGEAGGFYDLGFGQVISASVYYEGLLNLSWADASGARGPVPFFELPFLGGPDQMKGFLKRRLIGHNALVANFEYRYPITWALDAAFFTNIGNTFEDLDSWDIKNNYLTYGIALNLMTDRSSSFEALLGWGSNRLDADSFDPFNQFRATIGVNKGF